MDGLKVLGTLLLLSVLGCREPIALDGRDLKDVLRDAPFSMDRRDMPEDVREMLIYHNEEFFEYLDQMGSFDTIEAKQIELFTLWPSIPSRSQSRMRTLAVSFEHMHNALGHLTKMYEWGELSEDLKNGADERAMERLTDSSRLSKAIGILQIKLQLSYHYSFLDVQSLAMCEIAEEKEYCKYHEVNKKWIIARHREIDFSNSIDMLIDWMRRLIRDNKKIGTEQSKRNDPIWVLSWLERLRIESLYLLGSSYHYPSRLPLPEAFLPHNGQEMEKLARSYLNFLHDIVAKWDAVGSDLHGENLNSAKDILLRDRGPWAAPSLGRLKMRATRAYALRNAMISAEHQLAPLIQWYESRVETLDEAQSKIFMTLRSLRSLVYEAIEELANSKLCQLKYLVANEIIHDNTVARHVITGVAKDYHGPVWEERQKFARNLIENPQFDWDSLYERIKIPMDVHRYNEMARMIQNIRMTANKAKALREGMLERKQVGDSKIEGVAASSVIHYLGDYGERQLNEIRGGFVNTCGL